MYRLCRAAHAALDGEGARRYGGRWNPPGTAVVYASATAALAVLELLVHVDPDTAPSDLQLLDIAIPDDAAVHTLTASEAPVGWRDVVAPPSCRRLGDAWVERGDALGLMVPSVVLPSERNLLLNPRHPDMARVRVVSVTPFQFDPRLLG